MNFKDKVKGLIFGQAIGDALGLGAEFMSKEEVIYHYPNKLNNYNQIIQDKHRSRWKKGAWTDDTDQFLCILDSILENKEVVLSDIAKRFYAWFKGTPMGIGRTTYSVLSVPQYTLYPTKAAELVWKMKRGNVASNGSLMRNSIVGAWNFNNMGNALADSENICELTHFVQRCKDSCKIMTAMIVNELNNISFKWDNIENIIDPIDQRVKDYINRIENVTLTNLDLGSKIDMGYTLKALSAGIWAYFNSNSFSDGLLKIINEGGDADTNGCIAGSILGTKFGFSSIPIHWIDGLNGKELLEEKVNLLLDILKLRFNK